MTNKLNKDEIFLKLKELEFAIEKVKDCESLFILTIKTRAIINEYDFLKEKYNQRVSEFKSFKETKEYSSVMLDLIRESNIFDESEIELKCDFSDEKSKIYCDLFNPDLIGLDDGLDWSDPYDYHLKILSKFINNKNIKPARKKHIDSLGLYWYYASLVSKNGNIKLFNPYYDLSENELMSANPPTRKNYLQSHADFYFFDNFICNDWFDSPTCISGHRVKNIDILLKIALLSILFQLQRGLVYQVEAQNKKAIILDEKILKIRSLVSETSLLKNNIAYIKAYLAPEISSREMVKKYHKNKKAKVGAVYSKINRIIDKIDELNISELLMEPEVKNKNKILSAFINSLEK